MGVHVLQFINTISTSKKYIVTPCLVGRFLYEVVEGMDITLNEIYWSMSLFKLYGRQSRLLLGLNIQMFGRVFEISIDRTTHWHGTIQQGRKGR